LSFEICFDQCKLMLYNLILCLKHWPKLWTSTGWYIKLQLVFLPSRFSFMRFNFISFLLIKRRELQQQQKTRRIFKRVFNTCWKKLRHKNTHKLFSFSFFIIYFNQIVDSAFYLNLIPIWLRGQLFIIIYVCARHRSNSRMTTTVACNLIPSFISTK